MSPGVRWYPRAVSTQILAHDHATQGAPHGTAIAARVQDAGRGTRSRPWHSPEGGLWLSVVCRPRAAMPVEGLSVRVGLAVAAALESALEGLQLIQVKWPNDLMLDDRKLGGILCEARWQGDTLTWIAVGIGLNVCNDLPAELRETAVSLKDLFPGATPDALAEAVVRGVSAATREGGPLTERELLAFAERDWLQGRALRAPVRGTAGGITREGALRVVTADGEETSVLGSVALEGGA